MKKRAFIITVVAAATAIFTASTAAAGTAAGNNKALIGVNPKDASLYSGKTFKCPGSNKVIPIEQVNDNYCDCPYVEGITVTDEPGTGACRNGVFYCTNHKFRAMTLPASRVNDGVCDCCDGSDEWLFPETGHCKDTCKEQGKKSYEADKARYAEMKKAVDSRKKLAAEATKELNEKSKALEELNKEYDAQKKVENELSVVERAKKEALDKKEDEVRKVREEREQREREEKERAEKEATEKKEKSEEIVDSTKVVVEPAPTLADEAT